MAVKVKEINIERGMPTVDTAMRNLVNGLMTAKMQGCRAAVVIHGWGSSGTGGKIKAAVKGKLNSPELKGVVRDFVSGAEWYNKKKEFFDVCPQLREFNRDIDGNKGITVVLLR
jgi:Smr domain.